MLVKEHETLEQENAHVARIKAMLRPILENLREDDRMMAVYALHELSCDMAMDDDQRDDGSNALMFCEASFNETILHYTPERFNLS